MAIEVSSNKKRAGAAPQWLDRALYAGVVIFIIAGGLAGFIFWANRGADKEKERITALIEEAENELAKRSELEKEILRYAYLVSDFKTVSVSRKLPSKFFNPFQKAVHPKVEVYSANISLEDGSLQFEGEAQDLRIIGQQFTALKKLEYISEVVLSSVSVVEDEGSSHVTFSIAGVLNTDLLKKEYGEEEPGEEDSVEEENIETEEAEEAEVDIEEEDETVDDEEDLIENNEE